MSADWSSAEGLWHLTAQRTDTGETVNLTSGFVFSCTGYYRYDHGYQPDFKGMDRFKGSVIHPQAWPADLDFNGKKVVVVGSGATAVTLIPSLAATASHVTMLQRSPTYIASLPAKNPLVSVLRRLLPDRVAGRTIRWMMALGTQASYQLSRRQPKLMKRVLIGGLKRQLPAGYDIGTHFTPTTDPWDQRLCRPQQRCWSRTFVAAPASVVTNQITDLHRGGIELVSGGELAADVIVTATKISNCSSLEGLSSPSMSKKVEVMETISPTRG